MKTIMSNLLKTGLLMAAIMALFGAVGAAVGGAQGMLLALALGAGLNFFAYWFSDAMVLRMYGAREVDAQSAPQFYGLVQELAARADLPMPLVYLIDESQPNAFATGRNPEHAAVAATAGLLQALASALAKIDRYARGLPLATAEANPATAQMMIVNPLSGGGIAGLFSTHPSTEERVSRLLALG